MDRFINDLSQSIRLGDFLDAELDQDQQLLGKMILAKSIGMIAGPRGGGKSWTALILAYAIAAGKTILPWGTGSGSRVLYLDGEMRASGMQERFKLLHARNTDASSKAKAESNFYLLSRDFVGDPIGSIDTEEGLKNIDANIHPSTKLIVVDNLSAWTSGGREDGSSWSTIKNWLIGKRLQGIAVMIIHHTGKNGQQRGSSMHEDLLDYSILLSPTAIGTGGDETHFGIEHKKLRDHIPELRQKYRGKFWTDSDMLRFEFQPEGVVISDRDSKIFELHDAGKTMKQIGEAVGVSAATVSRAIKGRPSQNIASHDETAAD